MRKNIERHDVIKKKVIYIMVKVTDSKNNPLHSLYIRMFVLVFKF